MNDCKVSAITNQKGGVGKTTTTVNLGIGLVRHGKRVLLIDSDPQGSLSICLGIKNPDMKHGLRQSCLAVCHICQNICVSLPLTKGIRPITDCVWQSIHNCLIIRVDKRRKK